MGQINTRLGNTLLSTGLFPPCRAATAGVNIVLGGLQVLDGVGLVDGDRVLVKDQTDPKQNGIYAASTGNWVRARDAAANTQLFEGMGIFVSRGTVNLRSIWFVTCPDDPIVIGTSALTFIGNVQVPGQFFYPVVQPSSGNLQGSGLPITHQLLWSDTNLILKADVISLTSSDPSAINTFTVTGTPANGTLTLTYKFNSLSVPVAVPVTAGQTTTQVAAAIATAMQAVASLFTPATGSNVASGGYGSGALLGYVTTGKNVVAYDTNSTMAATVRYAAGSSGLTLTFQPGQNAQDTDYALFTGWDNNPVIELARLVPGLAPPAKSILGAFQFAGAQSSSPSALTVQYGIIFSQVVNSTTGALQGRIGLVTPDVNNQLNQGIFVGNGLYTVGAQDNGIDTITCAAGFYYRPPGSSGATDIRQAGLLATPGSSASAGSITLTAANLLAGVFARTGPAADFSDTTDTAANIYAAMVLPVKQSSFFLLLINQTSHLWTITPGAGVSLVGNLTGGNLVIVSSSQRMVLITVTQVTPILLVSIIG